MRTRPSGRSAAAASGAYEAVMRELDQEVGLGGQRVKRGAIVRTWLDAAVFHDSSAQRKPYEDMLSQLGRAVEGMAAEHTEELARAVLGARRSGGRRTRRTARAARPSAAPAAEAAWAAGWLKSQLGGKR